MSRATSQSLALIAIMAGAASEINSRRLIAHVGIRNRISKIYDLCSTAINQWPETGNGIKNQLQITHWLHAYDRKYCAHGRSQMSAQQMVAMCDAICNDLLAVLRNAKCRRMIETIHGEFIDVLNWIDPNWGNLPAFERGGEEAEDFERVIGLLG